MTQDAFIKLPRLYVENDLQEDECFAASLEQAHYLRNVLRARAGERVRLFNGRNGEWLATLDSVDKKGVSLRIGTQLRNQPEPPPETHIYFAPIKKARMDWLVEKAVELGATHLHPVLTQNTEVRAINEERIRMQITQAAEQCERMDVPRLLPLQALKTALTGTEKLLACLERKPGKKLEKSIPEKGAVSFLIGPEGGFSEDEKNFLSSSARITPISLGSRILRSETAAIVVLCAAGLKRDHG